MFAAARYMHFARDAPLPFARVAASQFRSAPSGTSLGSRCPLLVHVTIERSISATPPLQRWQKPSRRKPGKKRSKSETEHRDPKLTRTKEKINKLKAELAPNKPAPTMETGPRHPVLPSAECKVQIIDLFDSLHERGLKHKKKIEISRDIELIKSGKLTAEEWQHAIYDSYLETDKARDLSNVLLAIQTSSKNEDYRKQYEKSLGFQLTKLSDEKKMIIEKHTNRLLSFEFNPVLERVEKVLFNRLPEEKKKYLEAKRNIMFRAKLNIWGIGKGPSMLPTLPEERTSTLSIPVDLSSIKHGDICSFVLPKACGGTSFAQKRITALEGEVVEYEGKEVVVPKGHCWVLGDNPKESLDSRQLGALPLENLRNKLVVSYEFFRCFPPHLKVFGGWNDLMSLFKHIFKLG